MDSTELNDLAERRVSRRSFARKAITGLATAASVSALNGGPTTTLFAQTAGPTDIDILQFAMNLEWLEAEFYTVATTGRTLEQSGFTVTGEGRQGSTTGGAKVVLTGIAVTTAEAITRDEQAHVKFLQTALGGHAIAKPSINLAALGIGFNSQNEFLTLSRAFEDVGVSAYGGAAQFIRSKDILTAAARIALTEAQHAGVLRLLVAQTPGLVVPPVDTLDVLPLNSPGGRLFQADENGLSTIRTPSQVLRVVLAGQDQRGGFFPDGFNGAGPLNRA